MEYYSRVAALVDLDAIYENLKALKANTRPGTKICAVVKTDGYGHGAVPIAKRVHGLADFFAVATVEEAFQLRRHGITEPILVLGYTQEEAFSQAIRQKIRLTVYDYETAETESAWRGCSAISQGRTRRTKSPQGDSTAGFPNLWRRLTGAASRSR